MASNFPTTTMMKIDERLMMHLQELRSHISFVLGGLPKHKYPRSYALPDEAQVWLDGAIDYVKHLRVMLPKGYLTDLGQPGKVKVSEFADLCRIGKQVFLEPPQIEGFGPHFPWETEKQKLWGQERWRRFEADVERLLPVFYSTIDLAPSIRVYYESSRSSESSRATGLTSKIASLNRTSGGETYS
jgi:hypothetical protein